MYDNIEDELSELGLADLMALKANLISGYVKSLAYGTRAVANEIYELLEIVDGIVTDERQLWNRWDRQKAAPGHGMIMPPWHSSSRNGQSLELDPRSLPGSITRESGAE